MINSGLNKKMYFTIWLTSQCNTGQCLQYTALEKIKHLFISLKKKVEDNFE